MTKEAKSSGVRVGEVITIEQYFEKNPQKIHTLNGDESRKGVMLNGNMIEIGSPLWNTIKETRVYHDELLGELRIIYH